MNEMAVLERVNATKKLSLKEKLDHIDSSVADKVYKGFYESRLRILMAQWEKGRLIGVTFRGVEVTFVQLEKETGRSRQHLKKWHQLYLKHPSKDEYRLLAEEKSKAWTDKALAGQTKDWYQLSESCEWPTPQWLFDLLNEEFHFTLDVCATKESAKCQSFYTKEQDGLKQHWVGTCWMNPPYGREIAEWMVKARESAENGATVVCLVPARPDTDWWWDNALAGEIRFIHGRLKWPGSDTMAPFPSAVIVLGNKVKPRKVVWWEISKSN